MISASAISKFEPTILMARLRRLYGQSDTDTGPMGPVEGHCFKSPEEAHGIEGALDRVVGIHSRLVGSEPGTRRVGPWLHPCSGHHLPALVSCEGMDEQYRPRIFSGPMV